MKNEKYHTVATIPISKVIVIKTFVLLSQVFVTLGDLDYSVYAR
jgi:hypothetical protein